MDLKKFVKEWAGSWAGGLIGAAGTVVIATNVVTPFLSYMPHAVDATWLLALAVGYVLWKALVNATKNLWTLGAAQESRWAKWLAPL